MEGTRRVQTCGYVDTVLVEREGDNDAVKFNLYIRYGEGGSSWVVRRFYRYLDEKQALSLAQLHLLRDAVNAGRKITPIVIVHFEVSWSDDGSQWLPFYLVRLVHSKLWYGAHTVSEILGCDDADWYAER